MPISFTALAGTASAVFSASGGVCFYHGTDLSGAKSIMTSGVSYIASEQIRGFGDFWATIDQSNAVFYAELAAMHSGNQVAIFKFELQPTVLDTLMNAVPQAAQWDRGDKAVKFLRESHTILNNAMTDKAILL